jgi:hypothetical protein
MLEGYDPIMVRTAGLEGALALLGLRAREVAPAAGTIAAALTDPSWPDPELP